MIGIGVSPQANGERDFLAQQLDNNKSLLHESERDMEAGYDAEAGSTRTPTVDPTSDHDDESQAAFVLAVQQVRLHTQLVRGAPSCLSEERTTSLCNQPDSLAAGAAI